jgi:hypothetical protein
MNKKTQLVLASLATTLLDSRLRIWPFVCRAQCIDRQDRQGFFS